ncbi:hypothetical protein HZA98_04000 [Candidatus Woesearchaeota archaeon]|nr:hypothetical protein [Candidatus Woesearchaeota archaeon]
METFEDVERTRRDLEEELMKTELGLYSLGAVTINSKEGLLIRIVLTRSPENIPLPTVYNGINITYEISTGSAPYNEI